VVGQLEGGEGSCGVPQEQQFLPAD
jgi:hypothetical protein